MASLSWISVLVTRFQGPIYPCFQLLISYASIRPLSCLTCHLVHFKSPFFSELRRFWGSTLSFLFFIYCTHLGSVQKKGHSTPVYIVGLKSRAKLSVCLLHWQTAINYDVRLGCTTSRHLVGHRILVSRTSVSNVVSPGVYMSFYSARVSILLPCVQISLIPYLPSARIRCYANRFVYHSAVLAWTGKPTYFCVILSYLPKIIFALPQLCRCTFGYFPSPYFIFCDPEAAIHRKVGNLSL